MDLLIDPLTDAELDRLERILLERVDEDAVTDDSDEGVLCVSELDGLFTALVSGPETVMPSQWLPVVWGDFEPTWQSLDEAQAALTLFVRHMNDIAGRLLEEPEEFEPMYVEHVVDGKQAVVVDEWCEGYMRGVSLCAEAWNAAPAEIGELLVPILAFTQHTDWLAHDIADPAKVAPMRDSIAANVRAIHAFWLRRRGGAAPSAVPFRRDTPQVGRNDPCPCGSGKKYKRCCLQ